MTIHIYGLLKFYPKYLQNFFRVILIYLLLAVSYSYSREKLSIFAYPADPKSALLSVLLTLAYLQHKHGFFRTKLSCSVGDAQTLILAPTSSPETVSVGFGGCGGFSLSFS